MSNFADEAVNSHHCLQAMALTWHPSGHNLTVAYGVPHSPGFCSSPGLLCQWKIAHDGMTEVAPQVRIATDCALQAVVCHAQYPSLLAAGTGNGGILVWDLSLESEDKLVSRSNTSTQVGL